MNKLKLLVINIKLYNNKKLLGYKLKFKNKYTLWFHNLNTMIGLLNHIKKYIHLVIYLIFGVYIIIIIH